MNKAILSLLMAAVLFGGCVAPPAGLETLATGSPTPAAATRAPSAATTSGPATLQGRVVLRSTNLSLIVEDPAEAMGELERRIEEAGGYVTSASASASPEGGYANLSARIPLDSMTRLRLAARESALQIQYDSTYSQDVTVEYEDLVERKHRLDEAEEAVWILVTETTDRQRVSSFQLLLDLIRQEALNIDGQLDYYYDSASLATLDISFGATVPTPYAEGATPTPGPIGVY